MEIEERLTRARIQIQQKSPFFAYLSLYMKFKKDEKCETAYVNPRGEMGYSPKFFDKLNDSELQGVIIHELYHIAFLNLTRLGTREMKLWNIATDVVNNTLIQKECLYDLPSGALLPNNNDVFEIPTKVGTFKIEKISDKNADEVYDELVKIKEDYNEKGGKGKGEGENILDDYEGFDKHEYEKLSDKEKREVEKEWGDRVAEAIASAKMRGELPYGIEKMFGELHREKIDWKTLLNNYITNELPFNYSYERPSKKSVSTGIYMPNILKEKIEVVLAIDLSGSVSQKEYDDFFSEIVGIARAYQERIDMKVYTHDSECYYCGEVRNGNIEELKALKLIGGGGTYFQSVIDKLNKDSVKPKILIWLTDGYGTDIVNNENKIIWVLSHGGTDEIVNKYGTVIKL